MPESAPEAAELEAAGLYDPAAPGAAERLALLQYLLGVGATIDDLVAAPRDELPLLASSLALWGRGKRLTIDEVSERAGVEPALVARAMRAAGFPEPDPELRTFSPRDVELLEILSAGIEFLGEEVTIQLMRVMGAAAARVADASVSAFMVNVAPQAIEQDPSGLALARANTESLVLLDGMTRGFDTLLRHHIERGFRPLGTTTAVSDVDLVVRSVGFADLVESTAWTQQLDVSSLARALTEFDAVSSEIVVARDGRLVKLIGDEVMFVTHDAAAAADIALELVATFADHAVLPPVRAGIATGEVLARDGDYSGGVVNLAARAVRIAGPSCLLVDRTTRDALQGDARFACGPEHVRSLKGFSKRVGLCEVTRAG